MIIFEAGLLHTAAIFLFVHLFNKRLIKQEGEKKNPVIENDNIKGQVNYRNFIEGFSMLLNPVNPVDLV